MKKGKASLATRTLHHPHSESGILVIHSSGMVYSYCEAARPFENVIEQFLVQTRQHDYSRNAIRTIIAPQANTAVVST